MENQEINPIDLFKVSIDCNKLLQMLSSLTSSTSANSRTLESQQVLIQNISSSLYTNSKNYEMLSNRVQQLEFYHKISLSQKTEQNLQNNDFEEKIQEKLSILDAKLSKLEGKFEQKSNELTEKHQKLLAEIDDKNYSLTAKYHEKLTENNLEVEKKIGLLKQRIKQKMNNFQNYLSKSSDFSPNEVKKVIEEKLVKEPKSDKFNSLESRIEQIEENLRKISFDKPFVSFSPKPVEFQQTPKSQEEKTDLVVELNFKYLSVLKEISNLRDMLESVNSNQKEPPEDGLTAYVPYITRIINIEKQMNELIKPTSKPPPAPSSSSKILFKKHSLPDIQKNLDPATLYRSPQNFADDPQIRQIIKECVEEIGQLNQLVDEKLDKKEFFDLINGMINKENKEEEFTGVAKTTESRIYKDLFTVQTENQEIKRFEREVDSKLEEIKKIEKEIKKVDQDIGKIRKDSEIININMVRTENSGDRSPVHLDKIEKVLQDLKLLELKVTKFSNFSQIFDIRLQDHSKRLQHLEDLQKTSSEELMKLNDRFRRTTLKTSEEALKALSQLQELELLRSNVQDIIQKMQEGSKLHKRDFETIQDLKKILESKTSKEEIDQKVDKNELKKMFRNLTRKVNFMQIDKVQIDVKNIEEAGVSGSLKLEEPLITRTKLSTECLVCGKDQSLQNKSLSKFPLPCKV